LKGKSIVRTGFDLGTTSVKIVRGEGLGRAERFTHVGFRDWSGEADGQAVERAAKAVNEILDELGLGRSRAQLGQIVTCVGATRSSVREVMMPPLTDDEFRQTLPFEARKFLNLDGARHPVVDGEVLEREQTEEGHGGTLVLMAAAERKERDFPVQVLDRAGLEPEVVDVEALALMRSLNVGAELRENDPAHALVDIGGRAAHMVISYRGGGLLSRTIWEGDQPQDPEQEKAWLRDLAGRTLETLTFYRGRYRREVEVIHLVGGGALVPGREEALSRALNREVQLARPLSLHGRDAKGFDDNCDREAVFTTACGLCRWGDV